MFLFDYDWLFVFDEELWCVYVLDYYIVGFDMVLFVCYVYLSGVQVVCQFVVDYVVVFVDVCVK